MPDHTPTIGGTRERLLVAAGEVFAEKGYRDSTIREIVKRAGANLNAVNYHFRDKQGLYRAVFEYAHQWSEDNRPVNLAPGEGSSAEERLRAFVRLHLQRILSDGRPAWSANLVAREMADPSGILDELVDEHIRPRHALLLDVVRELMGGDVPEQQVWMSAASILGQCLHYNNGRPVITRLHPELKYDSEGIESIADHITQFSLAALRNMPSKGVAAI
jgi:AcrR family transcriptional regulator